MAWKSYGIFSASGKEDVYAKDGANDAILNQEYTTAKEELNNLDNEIKANPNNRGHLQALRQDAYNRLQEADKAIEEKKQEAEIGKQEAESGKQEAEQFDASNETKEPEIPEADNSFPAVTIHTEGKTIKELSKEIEKYLALIQNSEVDVVLTK